MSNPNPTPSGASRRTILKTAAWSTPVVIAAFTAPQASASTVLPKCAELPAVSALWAAKDPLSGRHQTAGANNTWRTVDGRTGYRQFNDNFYRSTNPAAMDYTSSISATFEAVVGQVYVFTYYLLGNVAAAQTQVVTTMDVIVAGESLELFSTRPTVIAGTQVPMGRVNATVGSQQFTSTWVATASGTTTFEFLFTMPPVAPTGITYNDDVWVSLPTISQPVGCV